MFYIKQNLPFWERIMRLAGAIMLAIIASDWLPAGWPLWSAWASAGTFAATALIGFCPVCALIGRRPPGGSK